MDKNYWLGRKRASAELARTAKCAEARLIHFDLAGRYSVKAALSDEGLLFAAETASSEAEQALLLSPAEGRHESDGVYYAQLEAGAAYLATIAGDPAERDEHLRMARVYRDRANDAADTTDTMH